VDVVGAIADPVRREILTMLRHGSRPAGAIAVAFEISRPAVSRHLRILRETGLVVDQPHGRERHYRLEVAPLAELDAWLAQLRHGWSANLDALETEVYRTRRGRREQRDRREPGKREDRTTAGHAAAEAVDQAEQANTPVPNEERTA
jgi:DNA-binding transcriptional ArsR family regulator